MEEEDNIRMSQVAKYIHNSIIFERKVNKSSYDKAADVIFDWLVEEVYKIKVGLAEEADKRRADEVLFEKIDKETPNIQEGWHAYTKVHDVSDYL